MSENRATPNDRVECPADRPLDERLMRRALELAQRGLGRVEPNPAVGCVIARGAQIVGEGWHECFGGPHAETQALAAAGALAHGAELFVTLEPCCHTGKTPPCTDAILAAGIRRVVVAQRDPFSLVNGRGLETLQAAGVLVESGLCESDSQRLNAPYLKLLQIGRPWIIAKWAATLDGKLAAVSGDSKWISSEASRKVVHELRGRMDAIIVGRGTVEADDPLLTARPPGPRVPLRVVLSSSGRLPSGRLLASAREYPVLVAVGSGARSEQLAALAAAGCECIVCPGDDHAARLEYLLAELARRRCTNILFEGGSQVFGCLLDQGLIDEVHVFVAPKAVGGSSAPSPIGGVGRPSLAAATAFETIETAILDGDWHFHGRTRRATSADRP